MANQESYDWHLQKMLDAQKRVGLIIQNGTKASNNAAIAHRMSHPSYKGLVDNSTGSKNMPFFLNKDESHIPLEHKIAQRTGGVLHTKAGQAYGHEILQRRARQVREQEAAERGEPPVPSPILTLTDEESKTLEFNNILQTISDAVSTGEDLATLGPELRNGMRLMIALAPTFTERDLTDIIRVCDNILEDAGEMNDNPALTQRDKAIVAQIAEFSARLRTMASGMMKVVNSDLTERKIKAKALGKEIFNVSGITEARRLKKEAQDVQEEEEQPYTSASTATTTKKETRSDIPEVNYINQIFKTKEGKRYILGDIYTATFPRRGSKTPAVMKNDLIKHIEEGKNIVLSKSAPSFSSFQEQNLNIPK